MAKILIVEDESIIALELKGRVKSFGFDVIGIADKGIYAIKKTAQLEPDLILMDINIKGDIDGIQTAEEILKSHKIPIIFITAFSDQATINRVKETRPYGLLFKPISEKDLRTTIELALDKFKLESKLSESEEKYRQFLYLSVECIYLFDVESKKIIDANNSFLKLLGYDIKDVKLLTAYDIIAHDKPSIDKFVERIMRDGPTEIGERNWRHKDGHLIPMDVTSNKMKVGNQDIIFIVAHNISKIKQINKKLRQSEQLYHNLVETSQDLIWQCDKEAKYIYLNPAWEAVFGYKIDEMLGKKFTDFQTPENAERDLHTFKSLFDEKTIRGYESIQQSKSGKELRLIFNAKAIVDDRGEILGTQGTAYDITERINFENEIIEKNKQLEKINLEKDKFFSIVAHDLQSPFNGLIGITSVMANNIKDLSPKELQSISREINVTATNISNLLKNLLEWSMLQRNLHEIELHSFSLNEAVLTSLSSLEQVAILKNIKIKNNISDSVNVNADSKMINSVFINLISNAIKFSNKGGVIKLSSRKTNNGFVEIDIADSGIGMDEELKSNLFKIDKKVGRKGTGGEPSTGIGLVLCKEFIEKHNGKIWVESSSDKGSIFYFTLPISK